MRTRKNALLGSAISAILIATAMPALAQTTTNNQQDAIQDELNGLDILTVIGSRAKEDVAGSITYLSPEELAKQNYTDIHRILRAVPGVNLQEEDGYGLRPNIGIRGSGTDRSSKVLILEDGVPMAPAPFSAPAAYYFPFAQRMNAIEITKTVGTIKYGPITTAGTIQFFSTPIPKEASANMTALISDLGRSSIHAWAGNRISSDTMPFDFGFMLETYQDNADGFKQIDIGETGFSIEDYVAKFGFYSKDNARFEQSLLFKYQYSEEAGDETYLGLTQADFNRTPLLRYRASQLDNIATKHKTYQATHNIELSNTVQLTTMAYRTEFARNWQKLDRFDNSQLSGSSACNSLNEILSDPTACSQEFQVLQGPDGYTSPDDVLGIRENNRVYYAQGIQAALGFEFQTGALSHNLVASVRYHEDNVDRFQQQDQYRIDNGTVVKTTDNAPGTQANRLSDAKSIAFYIEDTVKTGPWTVTGGLRFEQIDTDQLRWSTPDRTMAPSSVRTNSFDELLPSLGVVYDLNEKLSLLGGVAKGFATPGPSNRSADAERSTSYEFGGRYDDSFFSFEAIGFFNDYSNLLAECTNSSGGSECDIGDTDNAGAANVYGLELTVSADLGQSIENFSIPVGLVYTYTDTELLSSVDSDIYGNVTVGDEIPYVPGTQLTLSAGFIADVWGINTSLNYVSEARDVPGQGTIPANQRVDGRTIVDLATYYDLTNGIRLHLKADNLFDNTYLAGRRPYGLRPGKPREIFAGISLSF